MTGPGLRLSVALAFFFLTVGSFLLSSRSGSVEEHNGARGDEAHTLQSGQPANLDI